MIKFSLRLLKLYRFEKDKRLKRLLSRKVKQNHLNLLNFQSCLNHK